MGQSCVDMSRAEQIETELATAESALREGNEGKARVCARRAVACAAEEWLARRSQPARGRDAMSCLQLIQHEQSFPQVIRQAAERLQTKITEKETAPFSDDPIADARLIVDHLMADRPDLNP